MEIVVIIIKIITNTKNITEVSVCMYAIFYILSCGIMKGLVNERRNNSRSAILHFKKYNLCMFFFSM